MRALLILALVINIAWAAIVCNQGTGSSAAVSVCSTETPYCSRYGAEGAETTYACDLCPPGVENCEQCVGNDAEACNKEGYTVGATCAVPVSDGNNGFEPIQVACSAGTTLCFYPTDSTDTTFTEYGCGLCPFGKPCTQCETEKGKDACNKPGTNHDDKIFCEVTTLGSTVPARCPSHDYCFHDKDTYDNKNVWGCGLCPGTGTNCDQCVGSNTEPPCNKKGYEGGLICYVSVKDGVTPVTCKKGVTECFTYTDKTKSPATITYGCGKKCSEDPAANSDCATCDKNKCNSDSSKTTVTEDEDMRNYNHGNVMMLNTLLLPLLLALWV